MSYLIQARQRSQIYLVLYNWIDREWKIQSGRAFKIHSLGRLHSSMRADIYRLQSFDRVNRREAEPRDEIRWQLPDSSFHLSWVLLLTLSTGVPYMLHSKLRGAAETMSHPSIGHGMKRIYRVRLGRVWWLTYTAFVIKSGCACQRMQWRAESD